MKKAITRRYSIQAAAFYVFLFLLISVPLFFWKGFDNGFDLVKSSVLKIAGGAFVILSSIYLMSDDTKKSNSADIYVDKTLDRLMLFFLISIILSALFSVNVYLSIWGNYETQIGALIYLILFIIYFLLPSVITDEKKFRITFLLIESISLIIALFTIAEYFRMIPLNLKPEDFHRPVSPIGHPVFSAGFMTLLLPFSVLNISGKKSKLLRVVVPLIILAGIIFTQTRSAYAALAVQIIVFAALYPFLRKSGKLNTRKYLYSSVSLFVVILFIFFFIIVFPENIFVKRFLSISSITHLPRWFLWKDSVEMFSHYPITGTGISTFSIVFENYASYELKYAEIKGIFLNAHSNFLNTFCTMGLIGGIAYTLVLIQIMRVSLKNTVSDRNSPQIKIFFFAFFGSIAGYAVFGIADFDEITILLYLFVLLSLFKIKNMKVSSRDSNIKKFKFSGSRKLAAGLLIIIFSVYSIYSGYIDLYAQNIYSEGLEKYKSENINGYINDVNSVIELKPNESYYRYKFANDLVVYSSGLNKSSIETRKALLERAKEEVTKADKNYHSHMECLALKSLIELELGNEAEGFRLRDELFQKDTTQFPYRTNLAVHYLNHNNDSAAIYEINSILSWDFKNIKILSLKVYYLQRRGIKDEAIETCRKILEIDPNNQYAKNTLQQLEKK